eukprot:TRINITY_DN41421_c0_g1_i1.p1 TRINITY_DN41421_c0_g1~~TRINITY_DN41421_c0_g1_i1.p1  ORF type:complete len:927 (+),score=201.69 TRINITY_DN41421_c0_g1_i1:78-2858(+)
MYRYVTGRQTFYPEPRSFDAETGQDVETSSRMGGRLAKVDVQLSEEQRQRLQSFVERFDALVGIEPAMRLVSAEVHTFFAFQACKVFQRLVKRFGKAVSADKRLEQLANRCASTMPAADGVSISRVLWALGRLCRRDQKILEAAAKRLPEVMSECGPITIATIWNAFEVLQVENSTCLDTLADEVLQRPSECDPPEVAIVLHAAAQLQFRAKEQLFAKLVPHVRDSQGSFSARHLAVCFHAAAKAGLRDEQFCRLVVERFRHNITETDALALTSVVYACGLLAFFDQPFFEAVGEWLLRALSRGSRRLESQQVSNMIYTFGKLGFCPEKVLMACAEHAMQDFWRFKPQELDNLTYGMALLKWRHDPYLHCLASHLTEGGRVSHLDSQSLVSMAYSSALLGFANPVMLRALGDQAIPKLSTFKAEEFSILVYSLGVLNFRHHDLLSALVLEAPAALPRFTTQNISNTLHGLGLVGFDRDDDFVRFLADTLGSRLREASAQDIANSVTALMRMCTPSDQFLRTTATHVTSSGTNLPLHDFTPQELANTVYGFDALQVFDAALFEQVAAQTLHRVEDFIPQEVANVIWAFSKQGFGSVAFFEEVLARCVPFAEGRRQSNGTSRRLATEWCAEDLEKPLAALRPMSSQLASYPRMEQIFRARFLDKIAAFLKSVSPPDGFPAPAQYQKDFAAWDLYQVGPGYTEELLASVGVVRQAASEASIRDLLDHYVGEQNEESLLARYGEKLLISVLPAARWVSSRLSYRLRLEMPGASGTSQDLPVLEGSIIVEPAHPKEDDEANQRRFKAESWREQAELHVQGASNCKTCSSPFRPVLLSTFLGNWRHRHTELVAMDSLVDLALRAVADGRWPWVDGFWENLRGEIELVVPHTPCLSCVGALAQIRRWAPGVHLRIAYQDWRDWRSLLRERAAK